MGGFTGFNIGTKALQAYQVIMQTIGHNIANADTEGFTKPRPLDDVATFIGDRDSAAVLIEAGAEMRSMGRVKWLDGRSRKPWNSPSNTTCFILRGKK